MKTVITTNTEKAADTPRCNSVIFSRILTVMRFQLRETRNIAALIAVMDLINTIPRPENKPGKIRGTVILLKVYIELAPRLTEASSIQGCICWRIATVDLIPLAPYLETLQKIIISAVPVRIMGRLLNAIRYAIPTIVPGSA